MSDTPTGAFRRASIIAAAAVAAMVLGGLGAGRLASGPASTRSAGSLMASGPAHAVAAPPQSLAFTADFFEAMGFDAREEGADVAPPAPRAAPEPVPAPCSSGTRQEIAATRAAEAGVARPAASPADSTTMTTAQAPLAAPHGIPDAAMAPATHLE